MSCVKFLPKHIGHSKIMDFLFQILAKGLGKMLVKIGVPHHGHRAVTSHCKISDNLSVGILYGKFIKSSEYIRAGPIGFVFIIIVKERIFHKIMVGTADIGI